MKRGIITILIITMLVSIGLVSCKNEIEPAQEELISVSFENGTSRALTATLETFDVSKYYWAYEAKKNDGSGLKSGETGWDTDGTASVPVSAGNKGLGTGTGTAYEAYKVPNFSKGYWNFRLFAYTDQARTKLVYWGEADAVLIDSDHHLASVIVNPVTTGDGYLKVGTITLLPASTASIPTEYVVYTDELFELERVEEEDRWVVVDVDPVDGIYTLPAKQYKFSRTYSYENIPVASGSVIVTVYSNLTTTVSGTLSELTTYAEFGADQNPDIITTSIGTEAINMRTDTETVNFTSSTQTATKVTASMPTEAAQSLITELEKEMGAKPSSATSTTSDLTLNLSVNTTEATETTITYEIGMEATLVYQKLGPSTETTTTTTPVNTLDDFVTIKIELQRGLTDVSVIHDTDEMNECTSYVDLQSKTKSDPGAAVGFFFYQDPYIDPNLEPDNEKAMLYIRTYSFSPFKLSYTVSKVVATIGSNQYETLEAAIAASTGDDMIVMVSNVSLANDVQVDAKELTINLNGYTVTGSNQILPNTDNYFTVEEKYGDYYDYEYDPSYIRIRHKEASIDSVLYNRLPQAFLAVTGSTPTTIVVEHDAVVVVKNTAATPKFNGNVGITIGSGKDITLDLNGFTVTNAVNLDTYSQVFAIEGGTLTIKDTSSAGTGLLTNGVMEGTHPGEWWGTPQYNYATNVIKNSGTLNVVSGSIIQTASGSICYAVDNNSTSYDTVLDISGGYLGGDRTVIRQFCNSTSRENTINMTGGIVEGVRRGIWTQLPGKDSSSMKKASVNISGGTVMISSDSEDYALFAESDGDGWDNVSYSLSGGYIYGAIRSDKPNHKFIIGGFYSKDPSAYVADVCEVIPSGNVDYPYTINGLADLLVDGTSMSLSGFRDAWNAGTITDDCTVDVLRDIDLSCDSWLPIGTFAKPFHGTINGNNHVIQGLTGDNSVLTEFFTTETTKVYGAAYGFIGVAGNGDVSVSNLSFKDVNIDLSNGNCVGTVIGYAPATSNFSKDADKVGAGNTACGNVSIQNVSVSGSVTAKDSVAGIMGKAYNSGNISITGCTTDMTVNSAGRAAGICGYVSYPTSAYISGNIVKKNVYAVATGVDVIALYTKLGKDFVYDKNTETGKAYYQNVEFSRDYTLQYTYDGDTVTALTYSNIIGNVQGTSHNAKVTGIYDGTTLDGYRASSDVTTYGNVTIKNIDYTNGPTDLKVYGTTTIKSGQFAPPAAAANQLVTIYKGAILIVDGGHFSEKNRICNNGTVYLNHMDSFSSGITNYHIQGDNTGTFYMNCLGYFLTYFSLNNVHTTTSHTFTDDSNRYTYVINDALSFEITDDSETVGTYRHLNILEPDVKITKSGSPDQYMTLSKFRDSVNAGTTYEGYTITLQGDVDLTGVSWTPIGTTDHPFIGTFDGGGFTISNLSNRGLTADTIDDANPNDYNNNNVGFALFNKVAGTVVVQNLKVSAYISGKDRFYAGIIGNLAESPEGTDITIENVEVSGKIIGDRSAGIIAQAPQYSNISENSPSWSNKLRIINCVNNATLIGDRTAGILASNGDPHDTEGYTRISGCTNKGFIDARNGSDSFAAGIVANTNTSTKCYIEDCVNTARIYASTAYNISMSSYIYNDKAGSGVYIIGDKTGDLTNSITDIESLINLYHCYSGGACLDENGNPETLRWSEVELRIGSQSESSNTLYVGLFRGIEYAVDADYFAEYTFTYNNVDYTFRFSDMDLALRFLNYSEMYKNLKVYADFEWTSDYSKEGDGPGYYSIDLNGHAMTLKAPVQRQNYVTINGLQKTVTIKNGTIAYDSAYTGYIFDHIEKGGKVVFENVTLSAPAGQQIISIYPSTNDTDIITVVIDEDCEGFDGKKIKCLSPGTAGDDCLVLNDTNVPVSASDSNWTSCGDGTSEYVIV